MLDCLGQGMQVKMIARVLGITLETCRGYVKSLIERAIAAKCSALVLTVDLQVIGQRHADIKNGLEVPPRLTLRNAFDIATKPAWAMRVLFGKRKSFGNIDAYIKGILDPADALRAADIGADAIVVSNHGGRQLDGAPATIAALPRIAEAAGHKLEVMFDGGIRSGQDVLKALALGAHSCLIGRAYLYGLGALGEAGVAKALSVIADEMKVSMSLTGVRDVGDVTSAILYDAPQKTVRPKKPARRQRPK